MRRTLGVLLGIVLGLVGNALLAPRVRRLWQFHELRSPVFAVAQRALDNLFAEPLLNSQFNRPDGAEAAALRGERDRLLPALDSFLREAPPPRDSWVKAVAESLIAIRGPDATLLLEARRFEALEPAAYWALACVDPAQIPAERREITLEAGRDGLNLVTGLRAAGGDPYRTLAFTGELLQGPRLVDLGDVPLEQAKGALFPPKPSEFRVPAIEGHTVGVDFQTQHLPLDAFPLPDPAHPGRPEPQMAFRVTELVPGKSVHLVWRVLPAEEGKGP
jgi:hypothetical protein